MIPITGYAPNLVQLTYMYACSILICMKRTSLFLRDDQLKKLEAIHAETGAPVAELIRRAVDAYLKTKGGKKNG